MHTKSVSWRCIEKSSHEFSPDGELKVSHKVSELVRLGM